MKSTIVILSAFLSPFRSGAEACVEEVPPRLKDQFDFTIVTARLRNDLPRHDQLKGGVQVMRVGFGHSWDKWLFPFLAPFAVRKLKPQIIHAVLESYAGMALVFCRRIVPFARCILTCQSTNTSLLLGSMHRAAHRVTAISRVLVERAKMFGKEATLIPNGVPYSSIRETCARVRKVPGRILFVGRLEPMKGVDTLLQALRGEGEEPPDVHIVGDGSQRKLLEMQARAFLPEGSFRGYLPPPEVFEEYAEAEIFVGLSRSEALGNVFLEAQAAGCAVVATNVGGIQDIVTSGVTGLLVPPDDPRAAGEAISQLLHDAALRQKFSEAGIANAAQYDWGVIAGKYGEVYQEVLR